MRIIALAPATEPAYRTSMQPRFALIAVQDEAMRNLQTVRFTVGADMDMRRSRVTLKLPESPQGNPDASAVLQQFRETGLSL